MTSAIPHLASGAVQAVRFKTQNIPTNIGVVLEYAICYSFARVCRFIVSPARWQIMLLVPVGIYVHCMVSLYKSLLFLSAWWVSGI